MSQCVAMCCSQETVLIETHTAGENVLQCVAMCHSAVQCVTLCCSLLQCEAVSTRPKTHFKETHTTAENVYMMLIHMLCSVLLRVAVCCSPKTDLKETHNSRECICYVNVHFMKCVAASCNLLQCVEVKELISLKHTQQARMCMLC